MAFVPPSFWAVTFTFKDNNDNIATTGVFLPPALPFADVSTFASGTLGPALQACSDARLTDIGISYRLYNDDETVPPGTSEVERKLKLTFDAGTFKKCYTMEVPSPLFTLEQRGTDLADPTSTVLTTLVNAMLNGPGGAGNGPQVYFGQNLTALSKAIIAHRNRKPRDV